MIRPFLSRATASTTGLRSAYMYSSVVRRWCLAKAPQGSWQPQRHVRSFYNATVVWERQGKPSDIKPEVLNPKHQLLIGFTCKVCDVRSHHVMSKQAYTKGVVLIQCPECKNRHLIADNLGWFRDTKVNVEDLVKEKGEGIRKIVVDNEGNKLPVEHLMEWVPELTAEEEKKIQDAEARATDRKSKPADE